MSQRSSKKQEAQFPEVVLVPCRWQRNERMALRRRERQQRLVLPLGQPTQRNRLLANRTTVCACLPIKRIRREAAIQQHDILSVLPQVSSEIHLCVCIGLTRCKQGSRRRQSSGDTDCQSGWTGLGVSTGLGQDTCGLISTSTRTR